MICDSSNKKQITLAQAANSLFGTESAIELRENNKNCKNLWGSRRWIPVCDRVDSVEQKRLLSWPREAVLVVCFFFPAFLLPIPSTP